MTQYVTWCDISEVFHEIIKENFVSPVPFIVKRIQISVLYHDASKISKNEGKI